MNFTNNLKSEKGNRKVGVNRTTQLFLLVGFLAAIWMKADLQLFIAYVVGVSGSSFAFMWGNTKEYSKISENNKKIE